MTKTSKNSRWNDYALLWNLKGKIYPISQTIKENYNIKSCLHDFVAETVIKAINEIEERFNRDKGRHPCLMDLENNLLALTTVICSGLKWLSIMEQLNRVKRSEVIEKITDLAVGRFKAMISEWSLLKESLYTEVDIAEIYEWFECLTLLGRLDAVARRHKGLLNRISSGLTKILDFYTTTTRIKDYDPYGISFCLLILNLLKKSVKGTLAKTIAAETRKYVNYVEGKSFVFIPYHIFTILYILRALSEKDKDPFYQLASNCSASDDPTGHPYEGTSERFKQIEILRLVGDLNRFYFKGLLEDIKDSLASFTRYDSLTEFKQSMESTDRRIQKLKGYEVRDYICVIELGDLAIRLHTVLGWLNFERYPELTHEISKSSESVKKFSPLFYYPFWETPNRVPWDLRGTRIGEKSISAIRFYKLLGATRLEVLKEHITNIYSERAGFFDADAMYHSPIFRGLGYEDLLIASHDLIYCGWVADTLKDLEKAGKFSSSDVAETIFLRFFDKNESAFALAKQDDNFTCSCEDTSFSLTILYLLGKINLLSEKGDPLKTAKFLASLQTRKGYFLYSYGIDDNGRFFCPLYQTLHALVGLCILDSSICPGAIRLINREKIKDYIFTKEKECKKSCLECDIVHGNIRQKSLRGPYWAMACLNIIEINIGKKLLSNVQHPIWERVHNFLNSQLRHPSEKNIRLFSYTTIKKHRKNVLNLTKKNKLSKDEERQLKQSRYLIEKPFKKKIRLKDEKGYFNFYFNLINRSMKSFEVEAPEMFYSLALCKMSNIPSFYSKMLKAIYRGKPFSIRSTDVFPYLWASMPLLLDDFPSMSLEIEEPLFFFGNTDKLVFTFENKSHFSIENFKFEGFDGLHQIEAHTEPLSKKLREFAFFCEQEHDFHSKFLGKVTKYELSTIESPNFLHTKLKCRLEIDKNVDLAEEKFRTRNKYGSVKINYPIFSYKKGKSALVEFYIGASEVWLLPSRKQIVERIKQTKKNSKLKLLDLIRLMKYQILPEYNLKTTDNNLIIRLLSQLKLDEILIEEDRAIIQAIKETEKKIITQINAHILDIKVDLDEITEERISEAFETIGKRLHKIEGAQREKIIALEEGLKYLEEFLKDLKLQVKLISLRVWHYKREILPKELWDKIEELVAVVPEIGTNLAKAINILRKELKIKKRKAYPNDSYPCEEGKVQPIPLSYCLKCKHAYDCEVKVLNI